MTRSKRLGSLWAKLLYALLLAAALGIGTFFLLQAGSNYLIERLYLNETAIRHRNNNLAQEFQKFVVQNELASTDTQKISAWIREQGDLYILFYDDETYAYGSGWWGIDQEGNRYVNNSAAAQNAVCNIVFTDGKLAVELCDYSVQKLFTAGGVMSVILACVVFTLVVSFYNRHVTATVIRLSQDVREIGSGNIDKAIYIKGDDELAVLAKEVDAMRRAILGQIQKEKQAYQANSDLITAISHDIRTPLTALIGYLDLMVAGQYDSDDQRRQYLEACQEKSMQLKDLTERLFQYFTAFSGSELPVDNQTYDAQLVLEQLLGEPVAQLRLKGFRVHEAPLKEACEFSTDMLYLKRVFDNLFLNVEKHADLKKPVVVMAEKEAGALHICVSNWIPDTPNRVESTKIGLKTCQRIMEQLHGQLRITEEKAQFVAEVIVPLCHKSEPGSSGGRQRAW